MNANTPPDYHRTVMPESFSQAKGIEVLDRDYRDPRGIQVHVSDWGRERQQVYFTRPNCSHEYMQPFWKFQQHFKRCD